jgi:hypothetical protein
MNWGRVARGEWIAMAGGLLVIISLFLPCYKTDPDNPFANIDGDRGSLSVWDVHPYSRWILLLAALAPFLLAYIIVREHQLSWPRGQATSVLAIYIAGFCLYWGFIDRPGEPSSEISLQIGWFGILLGAILMFAGSFMRTSETEVKRKPPGTL